MATITIPGLSIEETRRVIYDAIEIEVNPDDLLVAHLLAWGDIIDNGDGTYRLPTQAA